MASLLKSVGCTQLIVNAPLALRNVESSGQDDAHRCIKTTIPRDQFTQSRNDWTQ
jgi:hypothetical protein